MHLPRWQDGAPPDHRDDGNDDGDGGDDDGNVLLQVLQVSNTKYITTNSKYTISFTKYIPKYYMHYPQYLCPQPFTLCSRLLRVLQVLVRFPLPGSRLGPFNLHFVFCIQLCILYLAF